MRSVRTPCVALRARALDRDVPDEPLLPVLAQQGVTVVLHGATFRDPGAFEGITSLVAAQPVTTKVVRVPTFIYQVHDDGLVTPDDVQSLYDALPTDDKHLHWIPDSRRRWDGYLGFQRNPQPMLDWIAGHTS